MLLPPLLEGTLLRRYKRFLADVRLADGQQHVVHCPNPGSMKRCAPEGGRVWVSRSSNPRRKLPLTWELVEEGGALVNVNTARANPVVAEALAADGVPELRGSDEVQAEVRYGEGTRFDFALRFGERTCFLEVKSVTLGDTPGLSIFPDSVTKRGQKHLRELVHAKRAGHRAVLLFAVGRDDTRRVRPADEIDPEYGRQLRAAADAGVELLAYRCRIDLEPPAIGLDERLPIEL